MRKDEQIIINIACKREFESALKEARGSIQEGRWKRLRTCSAEVLELYDYAILRSYNTIIACVNLNTGVGYDLLRLEYGYTATSAQHIAKFFNDYSAKKRYRWQDVH